VLTQWRCARTFFGYVVALAIVCATARSLWGLATTIRPEALDDALSVTPWWSIVLSALGVAVSFGGLAVYERFATAAATPGRVTTGLSLGVGMTAHAIANTLGFHVLVGAAVRCDAYRGVGLTAADVARVMTLVGIYVVLGSVALLGVSLIFGPAMNGWPGSAGPRWQGCCWRQ
jgi:uncharacterized membrane protein YbhN (UPF0104 family)